MVPLLMVSLGHGCRVAEALGRPVPEVGLRISPQADHPLMPLQLRAAEIPSTSKMIASLEY